MGLTRNSTGRAPADPTISVRRVGEKGKIIAFAGNPNVGKSTLFNGLTGMKQHTGNWPGKTVEIARGYCSTEDCVMTLVDLPGTYSLLAHSREEEVARDFLCSGLADLVVVVCDATCLERNLNLAIQVAEITPNVLLCVNLMDEAARKGIRVCPEVLSRRLGVPVVTTDARKKEDLSALKQAMAGYSGGQVLRVPYAQPLEQAISLVMQMLPSDLPNARWKSRRLLEGEEKTEDPGLQAAVEEGRSLLQSVPEKKRKDLAAEAMVHLAESVCREAVTRTKSGYRDGDRRLDRFFTGRRTGYAAMLLMLGVVFWITIVGANGISDRLSAGFAWLERILRRICVQSGMAPEIRGLLMNGIYRVLTWVVSVMLPPMAIFFPLFTLLEDAGVLPRIAYNLDRPFQCCHACGKQALTMCMGFGCNAAGVSGCRIIDSPRERLLAILTNSFVPCNGRFPALLLLITLFFTGNATGFPASVLSALLLMTVILLGVGATFLSTRLLTVTFLRGVPSSFTLELPPYRKPRIGNVIVRSVVDRTLIVLGRAVVSAAPAGMILYLLGNYPRQGESLLLQFGRILQPVGAFFGLDGVILLAFLVGLPANEIVIPIVLMAYTQAGSPVSMGDTAQVGQILLQNGWNLERAVCTTLFFLMHWPCATTLLTIRKETGSLKWTGIAALLPTAFGLMSCLLARGILGLIRWLL